MGRIPYSSRRSATHEATRSTMRPIPVGTTAAGRARPPAKQPFSPTSEACRLKWNRLLRHAAPAGRRAEEAHRTLRSASMSSRARRVFA